MTTPKAAPDAAEHYSDQMKLKPWDELVAALELCGRHCCGRVHHAPHDRHRALQECPVEVRIVNLLARAKTIK